MMSFKKLQTLLFIFPAAVTILLLQSGCQTTPAPPSETALQSGDDTELTPSYHTLFSAPDSGWSGNEAPAFEPHPPVRRDIEPLPQYTPPREPAPSSPIHSSRYTVVRNDTLWNIARRSGTPLEALRQANGLTDTHLIHPGQELVIPSADKSPSPVTTSSSSYQVERGDTLSEIALRFQTTVDSIKSLNSLESDLILSGQSLTLQESEQADAPDEFPTPNEEPEENEEGDLEENR